MERAYLNINIPNMISVGIIAAILWLGYSGVRMYTMKNKG